MKRTYHFVEPSGVVVSTIEGQRFEVPVFGGILKHPTPEQLIELLKDSSVVRRYTREALRQAPWCVLRQFPRPLLIEGLPQAGLPVGRRRALELILGLT